MSDPQSYAVSSGDALDLDFGVRVRVDGRSHVVQMWGELDLSSRPAALAGCISPLNLHVIVDMSELTFMDCAGYRALVTATAELHARNGSMALLDPAGEPLHLLQLLRSLGLDLCCPVHFSADSDSSMSAREPARRRS